MKHREGPKEKGVDPYFFISAYLPVDFFLKDCGGEGADDARDEALREMDDSLEDGYMDDEW